jgi:hypothetical protein
LCTIVPLIRPQARIHPAKVLIIVPVSEIYVRQGADEADIALT